MSIFEFNVSKNNTIVPLTLYKEKRVILIVNVASEWGLTKRNYENLQRLQTTYYGNSFTILAFPCNQFGNQEPKNNEEIRRFVKENYQISFPIFDKINVNGNEEILLYTYLKNNCKYEAFFSNFFSKSIKWNFTKFLCVDGIPVKRYEPLDSFSKIENDIKYYL